LIVSGALVRQFAVAEDGAFAGSWMASGVAQGAPWPVELRWSPDVDTLLDYAAPFPTQAPVAGFSVGVTPSSWRILVDHKKFTVTMPAGGEKVVRITGTLQRSVAGQWQPQPGVGVMAAGWEGVSTDGSGRFSTPAVVSHDETVTVVTDDPVTLFLTTLQDAPTAAVTVDVIPKSRILWPTAAMAPSRDFRVRGRLMFDRASATDAVRALQLQESKNCSTGWRTVSTIRTWSDSRFDVQRRVPHPTWCLRLRFAGTAAIQPSVSSTYRTSLRETRIANFAVKVPTVAWDPAATFSGKVQVRGKSGWYSLGKKTSIQVWWKPVHQKYWDYWVPSHATSSTGSFRFKQFLWKDADWYLVARINDGKHLWAYSPTVFLDRP
jgi:hypothetical protein